MDQADGNVITPQERAAYTRGFACGAKRGFWTAATLYALATVLAILAFHALAVHP